MKKPAHVIEIFLPPGDFYFGDENTRIRTILGSCVSITMWHPTRLIGGMCHYMLPSRAGAAVGALDGRYADEALQMFTHEIRAAKTRPSEYRVKLFGAGHMFPGVKNKGADKSGPNVPDKNKAIAYALVEKHGLKIDAEDLGGDGHRQVLFDIWSGHAWVRKPDLLNTRSPKDRT
jgi:chemotaxis protein CheD